jgi:hypothetical protein
VPDNAQEVAAGEDDDNQSKDLINLHKEQRS